MKAPHKSSSMDEDTTQIKSYSALCRDGLMHPLQWSDKPHFEAKSSDSKQLEKSFSE